MTMTNKCPNCKSNKSTQIAVTSSDGYSNMYHRGAGAVYPLVCLNCGTVYIDKNKLEMIRKSEDFKNGNL